MTEQNQGTQLNEVNQGLLTSIEKADSHSFQASMVASYLDRIRSQEGDGPEVYRTDLTQSLPGGENEQTYATVIASDLVGRQDEQLRLRHFKHVTNGSHVGTDVYETLSGISGPGGVSMISMIRNQLFPGNQRDLENMLGHTNVSLPQIVDLSQQQISEYLARTVDLALTEKYGTDLTKTAEGLTNLRDTLYNEHRLPGQLLDAANQALGSQDLRAVRQVYGALLSSAVMSPKSQQ